MPTPSGYHGQSLEKDLKKIRDLFQAGDSAPTIAVKLYKDVNKKNTVDAAIKSMIDGSAPIKITNPRAATSGKNQFQAVRKDPERLSKILKDIPKMSRRQVLDKYDISSDALGKIVKDNEISFGIVEKGKPPFQERVTENIKKLQSSILKNPNATGNQLIKESGLTPNEYNATLDALQKTYARERPGFKPNEKIKKKVLSLKTNIPSTFESQIKDKGERQILTKSRKAVSEFFPKTGTNFEHTFPRSLIPYLEDETLKEDLLKTGSRTSDYLNQFKRKYDLKLKYAVDDYLADKISLNEYNKKVNETVRDVKKATGGYKIGYLQFDKNKVPKVVADIIPFTKGVEPFGPETSQRISAFDNIKYHENLRKNYLKNPESPMFDTLRKYESVPEKIPSFENLQKEFNKVKPNLNSTQKLLNFSKRNINNPVVRALFKSPYGAAAAVTAAALTPATLMAEEKIIEETKPKLNFDKELQVFTTDNPDTKASQSDILYWLADNEIAQTVGEAAGVIGGATLALGLPDARSTIQEARSAGRGALGTTGKVLGKGFYRLGSPLATAAFTVPQALDENISATEMATDPLNYLGLATMETLSKRAGSIAAPAVAAETSGILGTLKNFATLKNVGEAAPGKLNAALRLGLNPRVIAGASRFLGIPGLIASTGYTLYDYLSNKESE